MRDFEYEHWRRENPDADETELWQAAKKVGKKEGFHEAAHLGVSVLVQQLATVAERLERLQQRYEESEVSSAYWRSDVDA